jgi:hypothetical protein
MSEPTSKGANARYRVVFTPVGWQVIDSQIARDPLHEFGAGLQEYKRAKAAADLENERARTPTLFLRGEA